MCYVTAKIITPAGLPLEEEEEGLLPPKLPEVSRLREITTDNTDSPDLGSARGSRAFFGGLAEIAL